MKNREITFSATIPYAVDVVVVTNKPANEGMLSAIEATTPRNTRIIITGQDASAAVNRNAGLREVKSSIFVMMDDDIAGFYPGWLGDLVFPMLLHPEIAVCSARLLNEDGTFGVMMGVVDQRDDRECYEAQQFGYRGYRRLPTACIAVRQNGIRFDERFIGSGFEDTAWMNEINMQYPSMKIAVNNGFRLTHLHHMQNQGGRYFEHNKAHYLSLYPDDYEVRACSDYTQPRRKEHFFELNGAGQVILVER
jgi:glycosyltransferase involved in cell wall biosynthesis